jgi:hypothetical protein
MTLRLKEVRTEQIIFNYNSLMKNKLITTIAFLTGFGSLFSPLKASLTDIKEVPFSYVVYNFNPGEGWRLSVDGETGSSGLKGKSWLLDFTRGAKSISISPAPISMLGRVEKIRLKVKGSAKDHPVHIYIQTHFMTFHKVVGKLSGSVDP